MKINQKKLKQLPNIITLWNAYHDTPDKIYEMDDFNEFLEGSLPLEVAQMLSPGFDAYREYFWYTEDCLLASGDFDEAVNHINLKKLALLIEGTPTTASQALENGTYDLIPVMQNLTKEDWQALLENTYHGDIAEAIDYHLSEEDIGNLKALRKSVKEPTKTDITELLAACESED
jgi:hypothetical protein